METHLDEKRQTVKLGLIKVIPELFPGESFRAVYSIGNGVYCELAKSAVSTREVAVISAKLRQWAEKGSSIQFLFKKDYYYYKLDDMVIKTIHAADTDARQIASFRLIPFSTGFIVDFDYQKEKGDRPYLLPQKLSEAYQLGHSWLENLKMEMSSDVNNYIRSGHEQDLISIGEAIHEKKISLIADMITQQRRALRVVLISGPSASGKTSFTKRLSTQLRVNGLKLFHLSLDDYFLDVEQRPLDEQGNYDIDNLQALDLPLLQKQIKALIEGEPVDAPVFDYVAGKRSSKTQSIRLDPEQILLIEGIHALNPDLLAMRHRNMQFKIYLGSLFNVNVDLMNRAPSTDARLIRRMVRGNLFRGVSPEQTFSRWPNILKGEEKNVNKFQEDCDVMFNSSLVYELNALRPFAEEVLEKVGKESPYYAVRTRLLDLLAFYEPTDADDIPLNSLIREFIGGSTYSPETKIKTY